MGMCVCVCIERGSPSKVHDWDPNNKTHEAVGPLSKTHSAPLRRISLLNCKLLWVKV